MIAVAIGTILAVVFWLFKAAWIMAGQRGQSPFVWLVVGLILTPMGAISGLWLLYPKQDGY